MFDFDRDMLQAEQKISVNIAGATVSHEASSPDVARLNLNQTLPVIQFGLAGDIEISNLKQIALGQIEPELRSIRGVQAVNALGGREQRIQTQF